MHNIHFIFKPLLGFLLTTVHLIILTEHFTALNVHVYIQNSDEFYTYSVNQIVCRL